MRLSNSNLEIIRQRPQSAKVSLSIYQPQAIFKARVNNASIANGARTIDFDTVSFGSWTHITDGQTMWIGTTAGAMDVGKVRVRSATSSQIVVSENDNIEWADNLFLTVFNYWELWPVYPHIIRDPNNDENVIFYKDYDIAYTNQNSILGTFVNMGPHRAIELDPASGLAQIYYSATGTYNLLGNSLTYAWSFEGACGVTGSTSATPGYIQYCQPGHYVTRLIVTDSAGTVDKAYRFVSVYNQANPSIQRWQLNSFGGSRSEGGYTANIKLFNIAPIQEHAVVVLYIDSYYGNTRQNLGGNYPNGSDILFVGYIDKNSIEYDYEHSEMTFDALSITGIMKQTSGFSVSVQSLANPSKWYELLDMDSKRALYHYLRWHTTALFITDFQYVGDDWKIQFFDSDRESMYDAVDNYLKNTMIGQTTSDRQGKVWFEVEARTYSNPTGSFSPPVMNITDRDWMNQPNIEERLTDEISYMEYGGVAYSGVVTGTFAALIGSAPGTAPGFYGGIDNHQGMALESQLQLNKLVGNIFANKNSPFPSLSQDMAGMYTNLDIAPQETVGVNLPATATIRNIPINELYIVDGMSWRYDSKSQMLLCTLEAKELVNGVSGETVTIPTIDEIGEGWSAPILSIPPLPVVFSPTVNDSGDGSPAKVLVHDPTAGMILTSTFNTSTPGWYQTNAGLTTAQYQAIDRVVICPNGAVYAFHTKTSNSFIARAPYAGAAWTVLYDNAALATLYGGVGTVVLIDLDCDPTQSETLLMFLHKTNQFGGSGKLFRGNTTNFVATGAPDLSTDGGGSWGKVSCGGPGNQWIVTCQTFAATGIANIYDNTAASLVSTYTFASNTLIRHVRAGATGHTLHWWNTSDSSITVGNDNLVTVMDNVGAGLFGNVALNIAIDSTGVYACARASASKRSRSFDGGYSWSPIANLPVLVDWVFTCCGESAKWIAVGSYVFYTNNFWNMAPTDKQGNLAQINPLFQLDTVNVVP